MPFLDLREPFDTVDFLDKQLEKLEVNNISMLVNYGIENLKFGQPVLVNNEVRIVATLKSIIDLRGTAKAEVDVVLETTSTKSMAPSPAEVCPGETQKVGILCSLELRRMRENLKP